MNMELGYGMGTYAGSQHLMRQADMSWCKASSAGGSKECSDDLRDST